MKTYTYRGKSTNTLYTLTLAATGKQDDYGRELVAYTLRENNHAPVIDAILHASTLAPSENIYNAWWCIFDALEGISESDGTPVPGVDLMAIERAMGELDEWASELEQQANDELVKGMVEHGL